MEIISYLGNQGGNRKKHTKKWLYSQFSTLSILPFEIAAIGDLAQLVHNSLAMIQGQAKLQGVSLYSFGFLVQVKRGVNITKSQYLKWNYFCSCMTIDFTFSPDITHML